MENDEDMLDTSQYIKSFVEETGGLIKGLDEAIGQLSQASHNTEIIEEISRFAHTVKGNSRQMGFEEMANSAQEIKAIAEGLGQGEGRVASEIVDLLFKHLGALQVALNEIAKEK